MIAEFTESTEPLAPYRGERHSDKRRKAKPMAERKVIAWDTEGMNLSGEGKPQHAVIFGCSEAEPLVSPNLGTLEMLEHIISVGQANPKAIHVGYGFRYDANMVVKDLPTPMLSELWATNRVRFVAHGFVWKLRWIPGKWLSVSRYSPDSKRRRTRHYDSGADQSVTIYDYSSFFGGQTFLKACESILAGDLTPEDRDVIAVGKAKRGSNEWRDLPEVLYYWRCEIQLIRRTMEKFRDVMARAGFALKEWYGPGALANYIIAARKMRPHLVAAQSTSGLLPPEVHAASKYAFAGGRFERFQLGRIDGPVNVWDINGAYPFALTMIPSLAEENGAWRHVERPTEIERFGVYRIRFIDPQRNAFEYRAMPLFRRNKLGLITFPQIVEGWYMSPEARSVQNMPGVEILEGWYWDHAPVYPWRFLLEMYETRQRMGKENIASLPFKLGPNSIYGKLAQTVGWNRKEKTPPRSHALLVAAWVTSYCRAMLWAGMMRAPIKLIAVETDSIITTATPEEMGLDVGDGLGQWGLKTYDEMVMIQSGVYHARKGDDWVVNRTRGLDKLDLSTETILEWLRSLIPGEAWKPLEVLTQPRFVGLGFALASNQPTKEIHCVWNRQVREIGLGDTGKRLHIPGHCPECARGVSPADGPHPAAIAVDPLFESESYPRALPWEREHPREIEEMRALIAQGAELLT